MYPYSSSRQRNQDKRETAYVCLSPLSILHVKYAICMRTELTTSIPTARTDHVRPLHATTPLAARARATAKPPRRMCACLSPCPAGPATRTQPATSRGESELPSLSRSPAVCVCHCGTYFLQQKWICTTANRCAVLLLRVTV
jgi:hypothetical protein